MSSLSLPRLSRVLIASVFVLAGCGSAEEPAAATAAPVATEAPAATETPVEEAASAPTAEATGTTRDDRSEQEIAVDKLDLMMIQLGISELEDLEDATSCVLDRLESENIEFTGEGTADLIALSACNETIISAWLPSTNPALPDAVWACTVDGIGAWIAELSIPDAEAFFGDASPPEEFIEQTAERCDVSADDLAAAF